MTRPTRLRAQFRRLTAAACREDGSATIEFVILFPVFMLIFLSAVESGVLMARSLMLDRGMDIAVRDLRVRTTGGTGTTEIKRRICQSALMFADCENRIRVELSPVAAGNEPFSIPPPNCAAAEAPFDYGANDQLMVIRACMPARPFFPMSGLGLMLPKSGDGEYMLVTASAFVNEPVQ
ncbi:TadE-like protein [Palleronia aestuarii]|uniref:TadE-like protein n=1 Tax=Palleronia aestuarii TaxID=568105 RepID=A0A2W7NKL5_9RHOB|nr:TadE family protein [Palleronia aestuarii]PZX13726.1 TadE-like protein [Palleronia aestuarii]